MALLDIPPFIATLGTLGIAQGLSLVVTDGQSVVGIPRGLQQVYGGTFGGVPIPILIGLVAFAVFHLLLYRTRFGNYIFALGGNREALKLAGVSDRAMLIATYVVGGAMAGFAALLMTARMNSAHPTARHRARVRCHRGGRGRRHVVRARQWLAHRHAARRSGWSACCATGST